MNKYVKYGLIGFAAWFAYKTYKAAQAAKTTIKNATDAQEASGTNLSGYVSPAYMGEWDNADNVRGNPWANYSAQDIGRRWN